MRTVDRPIHAELRKDGTLSGGWWHDVDGGRMVCDLCPRECNLKPGDRGFCFVRQNRDGEMVLTTYGKSTGFCIDPIEKKPLNHFHPGTSVLSFGTAGCNLGCKFCQNHDISKARKVELLSEHAMPETIATAAVELGCKSVAYTYNDPIIWAEYAIDTAKACREVGVKSVAVTAGYITPQARGPFFEFFDAANVDLKSFSEEFYEKVTLSHLQPVLDTLHWLHRETDVWFEITNLIIPGSNDSTDELTRLCDWVLTHVGDKVPIHFSAFHPDFKMLDRPRTPHEKLLEAHAIARQTGLKYVYVGNVHDAKHQSTYCDACGKLVIERDWYQLGTYHLDGKTCKHCGHNLPGRFGKQPGDWGRKRQPVKISEFVGFNATRKTKHQEVGSMTQPPSGSRPAAPNEKSRAIVLAASELVAAAVTGREMMLPDPTISGAAATVVNGVYVSLKRNGRLRGCCGFTGSSVPLVEGMKHSARQTALEDPRLPPVSKTELEFLDVEVWMLGKLLPVNAKGADRIQEIKVGRDGLLIQRGEQRGLLLPGVATDNEWDEEKFLQQVCVKAKLPPTAWREPDTVLQRFEGIVARGSFDKSVLLSNPIQVGLVNRDSVRQLAEFCQQNVQLINRGALPNYYLQGISDGMVNGIVLSATQPNGLRMTASKISLRPPMPLQATLFGLCEQLAQAVKQQQVDVATLRIDLAILDDPAMHGTTAEPDVAGADGRALFALGPGQASALLFQESAFATETLVALKQSFALRSDQLSSLYSFRCHGTSPLGLVNKVAPVKGPEVRPAAVVGKFYPSAIGALASSVRRSMPKTMPAKRPWRAAMVPHAGLRFSGKIAAEVLAHIEIPGKVIVVGPKHTRQGVDWAVAPHRTWTMPGVEVANDQALAQRLAANIPHLELDAAAHAAEHSIEVELPLLHHLAPHAKVVGVAIGSADLESCRLFSAGLAKTLSEVSEDVLLLISSDMNHFASDAENRRLDELAIQAIERLNTQHIFDTVRGNSISMCGLLPAIMVLDALQFIQPLKKAHRVNYATSADVTGDKGRVVGYAGMLFE